MRASHARKLVGIIYRNMVIIPYHTQNAGKSNGYFSVSEGAAKFLHHRGEGSTACKLPVCSLAGIAPLTALAHPVG